MEPLKYRLPNLADLCGEGFFESWQDSFGTADTAIASFVKRRDLPTPLAAAAEIDQLLALMHSEAELIHVLRQDLACFAEPVPEHQTWTNWLRWVQEVLGREVEAALSRRQFVAGPDMRILSFPTDRSVGILRRHDPHGVRQVGLRGHHPPSNPFFFVWEFFSVAQGDVVAPEGMPLELLMVENGRWDPSPLPVKEPPRLFRMTSEQIRALADRTAAEILADNPPPVRPDPIDLAFLEHLAPDALYQLAISDTRLVGDGLKPIQHLWGLRSLELHQQVDDRDLALLAEHRRLEALSLGFGSRQVSDSGLRPLQACTEIRVLHLGETQVTDLGMWHLRGCIKLEELNLSHTAVGTEDLAWIEDMRQLWRLDLEHTQVTRAGLARLATLGNLHWLTISSPHITEQDLNALRRALPNCSISQVFQL
ncbi:MAG TPA: contact-dependent growth inhibition system immunity protein [Candidatus Nanopelagicaceae bacterium]|nr:contact-dependent growth inhibition system immunity protein [Candidatus Nanopelagicaceae bacterium]